MKMSGRPTSLVLIGLGIVFFGVLGLWLSSAVIRLDRWEYARAREIPEDVWWFAIESDPVTRASADAWDDQPPLVDEHWFKYVARTRFEYKRDDEPAGFVLETNWPPRTNGKVWLNGVELTGPMEGSFYERISGIDARRLANGLNVLTVAAEVYARDLDAAVREGRRGEPLTMKLRRQSARKMDILIGPILGEFDEGHFTVSGLANMKVEWSVVVDAPGFSVHPVRPEPTFCQTFQVRRDCEVSQDDSAPSRVSYVLRARFPGRKRWHVRKSGSVNMAPLGEEWSFVALGDSRSRTNCWKQVIEAAGKEQPRFIVHSGDFVSSGLRFQQWVHQFSAPARMELATIPFYAVLGNHEQDASIFDRIIALPGTRRAWVQKKGDVLLIGIDGKADWMPGSELYNWLKSTLEVCDDKYVLLFSHYPVLSSSGHSSLNEEGDYKDSGMRVAHDQLMPLCEQYGVTAYIAGHDHCYERSETGKLTAITSGGAGAPLYGQRKNWRKHNPHSTIFYKGLHYLVLTVTPRELRMRAVTPEGYVLDHREWKPRQSKSAE